MQAAAPASPKASTLPRSDEQRTITAVLEGQGMRVSRVIPSKFDWLFGAAAPRSAVFEVTVDGQSTWADVHFLDRSVGNIVACSGQPMTSRAGTFSVAADGRPQYATGSDVTGQISSGATYFAASDHYFVMTPDLKIRELLARSLTLTVPGCREPVDLPVLPWEQEVVAALTRAGIQLTLIGGSKLESSLGERLPARVFISRTTSVDGGADVLHLERPMAIRVCATPTTGLNRVQIFVDERRVSDGEAVRDVHFSVGDRYFVQTYGATFHEALMRGLGTREPPC